MAINFFYFCESCWKINLIKKASHYRHFYKAKLAKSVSYFSLKLLMKLWFFVCGLFKHSTPLYSHLCSEYALLRVTGCCWLQTMRVAAFKAHVWQDEKKNNKSVQGNQVNVYVVFRNQVDDIECLLKITQ